MGCFEVFLYSKLSIYASCNLVGLPIKFTIEKLRSVSLVLNDGNKSIGLMNKVLCSMDCEKFKIYSQARLKVFFI